MSGGGGSPVLRAAARGVVAAMAMTGMRRMTTGLGLVEEPPPEEMAKRGAVVSQLLDRLPPDNRDEAIELAHWTYGAFAGAIFGAVWRSGVRSRWAGPAYGLAIWTLFETGLVPLLGLEHARERNAVQRITVAADHVLYGLVVAGRPRPPRG